MKIPGNVYNEKAYSIFGTVLNSGWTSKEQSECSITVTYYAM